MAVRSERTAKPWPCRRAHARRWTPSAGSPAGDGDPAADRQLAQGAADEEVGAPLEPEEAQVEHGVERGAGPCHGVYSAAVTAPLAS